MLLDLSADQELYRDTTARFLREHAPVGELRRLRDEPAGYVPELWRRGAELGWTSLLVPDERGGGSISGAGLVDLTLVAHEFGRHAAPGPLIPTNVVAAALSADGAGDHDPTLQQLISGTAVATLAAAEPRPNDRLGALTTTIRADGDHLVVDGVKRPVESADQASHLLVTGLGDGRPTQVLVPADAEGVTVEPMHTVDLTRRFARVTFEQVRVPISALVGERGDAQDAIERQLQIAVVLAVAESVGAMQSALDMTVEWAFDRYSFGRPLASYQELKHRFADMKTWLEASHAIGDAAAQAVAHGHRDAAELASAAKAYVGDHGSHLLQDCVQLHGGIGLTFEHDLHLYLRRHTVDRALYGTPADHRERLTAIHEQRKAAA